MGPVGHARRGRRCRRLIITVVVLLMNGGGGGGGWPGARQTAADRHEPELADECRTGEDANQSQDCRIVGVVNWCRTTGRTRCAAISEATDDVLHRPGEHRVRHRVVGGRAVLLPARQGVYIDLGFFDELESQFGARGGPFAEAYVIAHEYGHHVQNLLGD